MTSPIFAGNFCRELVSGKTGDFGGIVGNQGCTLVGPWAEDTSEGVEAAFTFTSKV